MVFLLSCKRSLYFCQQSGRAVDISRETPWMPMHGSQTVTYQTVPKYKERWLFNILMYKCSLYFKPDWYTRSGATPTCHNLEPFAHPSPFLVCLSLAEGIERWSRPNRVLLPTALVHTPNTHLNSTPVVQKQQARASKSGPPKAGLNLGVAVIGNNTTVGRGQGKLRYHYVSKYKDHFF